MKTKQELEEEIIELYGAIQVLNDVMDVLHEQQIKKIKQMNDLKDLLEEIYKEKNT
jgi:predicted  nucleic acid-binding Zn-ribbon protein